MFKEHMRRTHTCKDAQFSPDETQSEARVTVRHVSNRFMSRLGCRTRFQIVSFRPWAECVDVVQKKKYFMFTICWMTFCHHQLASVAWRRATLCPGAFRLSPNTTSRMCAKKFRRAPQAEGVSGFQMFVWNEICKAEKKKKNTLKIPYLPINVSQTVWMVEL